MKVAIITYHKALNYGAVLQGFALQCAVKKRLTSEADICRMLDYDCDTIQDMRKLFHLDKRILKDIIKFPFNAKMMKEKVKRFDDFVKKNIEIEHLEGNDLSKTNDKFDIFITGSDQVWNCDVCGEDNAYFLDFVNNPLKKRSYAASVGMKSKFEAAQSRILNHLKDFPILSVREKTCIDVIQDVVKDVRIDIDPTLLLDINEWGGVFTKQNKYGNYILVYCVAPPKNLLDIARDLSKKTGYKVIFLTDLLAAKIKHKDFECLAGQGPEEFLNLIWNAKYVLTTSYHGTVFSLLFHKNLYAEVENANGHNDRIANLIHQIDGDVFINQDSIFCESVLEQIDWDMVDENIRLLKEDSLEYIDSIISTEVIND